jgi:hypothetical protein
MKYKIFCIFNNYKHEKFVPPAKPVHDKIKVVKICIGVTFMLISGWKVT